MTARRNKRQRDDDEHGTRQIAATAIAIAAGRLHVCALHGEPYASPLAELTDPNQLLDKLLKAKETRAIFSSRRQLLDYVQAAVAAHPICRQCHPEQGH